MAHAIEMRAGVIVLLATIAAALDCGSPGPNVDNGDCEAFDFLRRATNGAKSWDDCAGNPCGTECTNHGAVCSLSTDGNNFNPHGFTGVCCAKSNGSDVYRITRVIMPPNMLLSGYPGAAIEHFYNALTLPSPLEVSDISNQLEMTSTCSLEDMKTLCKLTSLVALRFVNTRCHGSIPSCIFTALPRLITLDLSSIEEAPGFSGVLPSPPLLRARFDPANTTVYCNLRQKDDSKFACPIDRTVCGLSDTLCNYTSPPTRAPPTSAPTKAPVTSSPTTSAPMTLSPTAVQPAAGPTASSGGGLVNIPTWASLLILCIAFLVLLFSFLGVAGAVFLVWRKSSARRASLAGVSLLNNNISESERFHGFAAPGRRSDSSNKTDAAFTSAIDACAELLIDPARVVVGKKLAAGGFGAVYRGTLSGEDVVLKEVYSQILDGNEDELLKEARLLHILRHPRIISFYGVTWRATGPAPAGWESSSSRSSSTSSASESTTRGHQRNLSEQWLNSGREGNALMMLVTEFCSGGSLSDVVRARTYDRDANFVRHSKQLLETLDWLHSKRPPVIHRDIKPANLLLDANGDLKVCDMGLARAQPLPTEHFGGGSESQAAFSSVTMTGGLGSAPFVPPEVMRAGDADGVSLRYDGRAFDIYSSAMTLYFLWSGDLFPGLSRFQIIAGVASGLRPPLNPSDVPPRLIDLLQKMWCENPAERPSAGEIAVLLADPMLLAMDDQS